MLASLWLFVAVATGVAAQTPEPSALPSPAAAPAASPSPAATVPSTPAGVVPADETVELAGTVSPAFAAARIEAAIRRDAGLQPAAKLSVAGVTITNPLGPGDELEAVARVHISGGGSTLDVDGTTNIHLQVDSLDPLIAAQLFYSDDPEKLPPDDPGVLFRGRVGMGFPIRLYAYHVAEAPDTRLYMLLRPASGTARIQVLGYAAGPTDAYGYAGHVATLQYLLERNTQESVVVTAASDQPYIRPLGYRALAANDLVTAIFDLRVLEGEPVDVEVIATAGDTDPSEFLGAAPVGGDGHGRTGIFALTDVPPLTLALAAGGPEPAPFVIGATALPNLVPGGRPLAGDYGVLRPVALQLSNPQPTPQSVYLYETPEGGSATTTIWFDGDAAPTQVGCVREPSARYLVKEFDLGPGETRSVTGSYMTDGASSFPLAFGLTSSPPEAPPDPNGPGGCNSRN